MIAPVIKMDTRELSAAVSRAARDSSKTLAEIVNKKLKFILNGALKLTAKASAEEIKEVFADGEFAGMIINARRGREGLKGLRGADMHKAIVKEMNRRLRAINFIRSQWKWALLDTIKVTGGSVSFKKGSTRMGAGRPAPRAGIFKSVTASGWNDVRGGKEEVSRVTDIKVAGVQEAINAETESTWAHIADKEFQRKVCDRINRS